jgi:hypothetical protein
VKIHARVLLVCALAVLSGKPALGLARVPQVDIIPVPTPQPLPPGPQPAPQPAPDPTPGG